ncbi:DUF1127 domain-containing protein [uncultured Methylobacterium sp.]|jgi:uncharacterized protein YjiS (DUF1127 family)|uniref:DUF1127 domain-containing protein n=1 Tax=uncultured Methylobacterium sp. TaxID=157278 RepID=UPI00260B802D|nr:DUF1127 domain-containing protein [uncultured Methylobacterium sp.]
MSAVLLPFPSSRLRPVVDRAAVSNPHAIAGPRARLALWRRRWSSRRELARELPDMTDAMLADVGLTRSEALDEVGRPFWRASAPTRSRTRHAPRAS